MKKKVFFKFPPKLVTKPVTYLLVKDYDLIINIFSARINEDEAGILGVELDGLEENIEAALKYLKGVGIIVDDFDKRVRIDHTKCQNCGACTSVCPTGSLSSDKDFKVSLDEGKCIVCRQCVDACPFGAIEIGE